MYGNGSLYRLDLVKRVAIQLIPSEKTPYFTESEHVYSTEIQGIDLESSEITVLFYVYNTSTESREKREITMK